jgi:hypothetical protein
VEALMAAFEIPGFVVPPVRADPANPGTFTIDLTGIKPGPELRRFLDAAAEFRAAYEALPDGARKMLGSFTIAIDPNADGEG